MSQFELKEDDNEKESDNLLHRSALYKEFQAEREEILKHKWIESEKAGHDIGFERALLDWIVKFRTGWRRSRRSVQSSR
ncbi:MAG: hypothetical protein HY360_09065 [Verrucomicrobia bacterium]|nr:hypothetical protein [Verrucomicrobiota bacterium]